MEITFVELLQITVLVYAPTFLLFTPLYYGFANLKRIKRGYRILILLIQILAVYSFGILAIHIWPWSQKYILAFFNLSAVMGEVLTFTVTGLVILIVRLTTRKT